MKPDPTVTSATSTGNQMSSRWKSWSRPSQLRNPTPSDAAAIMATTRLIAARTEPSPS